MLLSRSRSSAAILPLLFACAATSLLAQQSPVATLQIQTDKTVAKVSPTLYGLMTEEINYSYDGGLYGELIQNRTFRKGWDEPEHWFLTVSGAAQASMNLDPSTGPSAAQGVSLKLNATSADSANQAGVSN